MAEDAVGTPARSNELQETAQEVALKIDNKGKKLQFRSCALVRQVATLIDAGHGQQEITVSLKLSKSQASRLLSKMVKAGLIIETHRSTTKFYKLTSSGRDLLKTPEVAQLSHGMKERIIRGSHDLYLKYPIANPEDAARIPKSFWDKSWNPGNGVRRCKYLDRPISMTITINQGCKSLSAQIHDFTVHDDLTALTRIFKTSWNLYNLFGKRFGVLLDIDRMSVMNEHKTYEDDLSRKMAGEEGKKFKIPLGRSCEPYTAQDPERKAWVELCRTPNDNWETNDKKHDRMRAMMPETVHDVRQEVQQLAEMMRGFMPTGMALANSQNYSAAAMKRLEEHAGRQTEILERLSRTRVSEPSPQGDRASTGLSEPRYPGKQGLEAYIGESAPKNVGIRITREMPGFEYKVSGETLRVRPKYPGAEIWLPEDVARQVISDGYAERIQEDKARAE